MIPGRILLQMQGMVCADLCREKNGTISLIKCLMLVVMATRLGICWYVTCTTLSTILKMNL